MTLPPRGIYVITDPALCGHGPVLAERAAASLRGGARMLQYRAKGLPPETRLADALALRDVCHRFAVPLIINDDVELARQVGAGLHLGRDDGSVAGARQTLGRSAIIGVSCYASLARAELAVALGANYVAFGSVFPSSTKPAAPPAPLALFATARQRLGKSVGLCAIGGIEAGNLAAIVEAGADYAAVINAAFGTSAVETAVRRLSDCYS